MKKMTKSQIEKFAVGYPYPTDWVETILVYYGYDIEKAKRILESECRTRERVQYIETKKLNETTMTDGVTVCCGYDFGIEQFDKRIKFCPLCGKHIVRLK